MDPTDFMKAGKAIDAGYQQTLKQKEKLLRLSRGPGGFQRHLERQRRPRGEPVMVSYFKVQTPEGDFEHRLAQPVPFDVREHENIVRLQSLIGDLGGLQKFEVSDYQMIGEGGRHGLLVEAQQKKV